MSILVEPYIFHEIIRPDTDFKDVDEIMKWDEYMRKPSTPITDVQTEMDSFLWEWLEFLTEEADNCLGLAAMQIGLPVRAFYIHLRDQEPMRFRNPEIVKLSKGKRVFKDEGCMSYPGRFVDTERHLWITLKDDINGEKTYTGLMAICIQHEMDHLNGKLCFDYKKHSTYIRGGDKIGRNDPCPCGSKKKFKKCCGG